MQTVISMLKDLYSVLPKKAIIRYAGSTGYGEKLMQTALSLEMGEIETIAHYTAAKKFMTNHFSHHFNKSRLKNYICNK